MNIWESSVSGGKSSKAKGPVARHVEMAKKLTLDQCGWSRMRHELRALLLSGQLSLRCRPLANHAY